MYAIMEKIGEDGEYHMPPPTYAAISTQHHHMNLASYINMTDNRDSAVYGVVVPEKDLLTLIFNRTAQSTQNKDGGDDK